MRWHGVVLVCFISSRFKLIFLFLLSRHTNRHSFADNMYYDLRINMLTSVVYVLGNRARHHQQHLYRHHNNGNEHQRQNRLEGSRSPSTELNHKDAQPKTASIRSRPISSRITTAELEELFQRQAELSPVYREQQRMQVISL